MFGGAQRAELEETKDNSWERDLRLTQTVLGLEFTQTWAWEPQEGAPLPPGRGGEVGVSDHLRQWECKRLQAQRNG